MTDHVDVVPQDVELERRVFGLEAEHGIDGETVGDRRYLCGEVIKELTKVDELESLGPANSVYLSNGARAYVDVGDHVEYATPECLTIRDLVAADLAGKRLLQKITAVDFNGEQYEGVLNTRVVDDEGATWGTHENYRTRPSVDPKIKSISGSLLAHTITRGILFGAGRLVVDERDTAYCTVQKLPSHTAVYTSTTTNNDGQKPHIVERDEPLAAAGKHRRLQIASGDPTMLPWATAVRFGSTSLVLRLVEAGYDLRDLAPKNIPQAIDVVSTDLHCKEGIELQSGKKMPPVDVQLCLAELCLKFAESHPVPEEEIVLAKEWANALYDMKKDPKLLNRRVDWVTKLDITERIMARHEVELGDKLTVGIDRLWGKLGKNGIAMKLIAAGQMDDPLNAILLAEQYMYGAPPGRGAERAELIRLLRAVHVTASTVNWELLRSFTRQNIAVGKNAGRLPYEVLLSDPFGNNKTAQQALRVLRKVTKPSR